MDDAIALQRDCGLDVLSDGEARRLVFTGSLIDAVEGIDGPPPPPTTWRGDEAYGTEDLTRTVAQHSVSAKLRRVRSVATEEFTYLRARTDQPAKATLPSPLMLGKWWDPESSTDAYADPFDAFADATDILKEEIRELVRLGCTYVQIDATDIATLADPAVRAQYDRLGIGAARMLGEGIELLDSITDVAAGGELTFAIHLLQGQQREPVPRGRRLRRDRRRGLPAPEGLRRPAARVRRRAFRRVRADREDPGPSGRRPRAGLEQEPRRRIRRPARRPDQAGRPFRSARAPRDLLPMRLRLHRGRQQDHARDPAREARARRSHRRAHVGIALNRKESAVMNVRRVVIATDAGGRSVVCERWRESPRPRLRQHPGLRAGAGLDHGARPDTPLRWG